MTPDYVLKALSDRKGSKNMTNLTAFEEIQTAVKMLKDAKLAEGPRTAHVSQWFADKAAEYGVTPQVLFDALMEYDAQNQQPLAKP